MDIPSDGSVKNESQAGEFSPLALGLLELPLNGRYFHGLCEAQVEHWPKMKHWPEPIVLVKSSGDPEMGERPEVFKLRFAPSVLQESPWGDSINPTARKEETPPSPSPSLLLALK